MFELGRMCVKLAGRDAGKKCVIVDVLDEKYVLIDGQTRRKKCNVTHLEPLADVLKIKKNESHEAVAKLFSDKGLKLDKKGSKERKAKPAKTPKAEKAQKRVEASASKKK